MVGHVAVGRVEAAAYADAWLCSATFDLITLLDFTLSRDTWIRVRSIDPSSVAQATPPLTLLFPEFER